MSNEISHAEQAPAARHAQADAEMVKAATQVLMHHGLAAAEAYLRANGVQIRSSDGAAATWRTE